ncbi:MAG: undecaprenyl phosphate translocase family protein, partial [Phycisphaerae bacterium]
IPLLLGMVGTNRKSATIGAIIGLTIMVLIAMNQTERPDRDDIKAAVAAGELVVEPNMARDLIAGVMGMSAMILPGISGAYMLLIIGRYEAILTAISICKTFLTSTGKEGDIAVAAQILIPVAIGALVGLVVLSNALKWLLRQKKDLTIGILLGILCGSVVGIWPFDSDAGTMQYATGAGLSILGFGSTVLLSRVGK